MSGGSGGVTTGGLGGVATGGVAGLAGEGGTAGFGGVPATGGAAGSSGGAGTGGDACIPDCSGKQCGDDGCGTPCGQCMAGEACDAGLCVEGTEAYEDLLEERVGFGRNARGGQGGEVCRVTSLADSGSGTLRDCATRSGPVWVRFERSGNINLDSRIDVASFKTIDGRSQDVTIRQFGLRMSDVEHVIIHNVRFDRGSGTDEDAISITNDAHDIWVDHVRLEDFTDGLLDITRAATDVTVSWSWFRDHDKVMLIGASVDHTGDSVIRVTLHHNYFEGTNQRHPRLRYGKVHAFNNYYEDWGSYAVGASQRSELLSEHNVFEAGGSTTAIQTQVGSDPDQGKVESRDDWLLNGADADENDPNDVFEARDFYSYTKETADSALRSRIVNGVGPR